MRLQIEIKGLIVPIQIGSIVGGPSQAEWLVGSVADHLACAVEIFEGAYVDAKEGVLQLVFHFEGTIVNPEFHGLRTGTFSRKYRSVLIQIAVWRDQQKELGFPLFLCQMLKDAIPVGAKYLRKKKIPFSERPHLELVNALERHAFRRCKQQALDCGNTKMQSRFFTKRLDSRTALYWEIGQDGDGAYSYKGQVGASGAITRLPVSGRIFDAMIEDEISEATADGYSELNEDELIWLVIQYNIDGMGSEEDLDRRGRIEDIIQACLEHTGNGQCDGGDIGSGTMNVFVQVVNPEAAQKTIIESLGRFGFLDGATIAVRNQSNGDDEYYVTWPRDRKGRVLELLET
jgi:hypothetical protein